MTPDLAVSWLRKLRRVLTTGVPRFTGLSFSVLLGDCVCHKAKVGGNPAWSEGSGAISPTAFVHFPSLGHIWVVLTGFQTSSLSLDLLRRSTISDDSLPKAQMWLAFFNNKAFFN